jgi:hypothetical protein
MSKQRVFTHVSKHWSGKPSEVWKKFFAWMGKRPDFEGNIEVFQFLDYSMKGRPLKMVISLESEPKEVT